MSTRNGEPRKATDIETIVAQAQRIALNLAPQLRWYDGLKIQGQIAVVELPYARCSYYGLNRTEKVADGALSVPRKHHRVLTAVTPPGLDRGLFRAFPIILHRAALNLGAPEGDGEIVEQVNPAVRRQEARFKTSHTVTDAICQWSLSWLEPGETWESIEAATEQDVKNVVQTMTKRSGGEG